MLRSQGAGVWALIAILGAGCTGPDPTPEELELAFDDELLGLELVSIPNAAHRIEGAVPQEDEPEDAVVADVERPPARSPRVQLDDQTRCSNEGDDEDEDGCLQGIGGCAFDLNAEGFPAISADGTEVVTFEYVISSGADQDDGTHDIVWRSVDGDEELRRLSVADGSAIADRSDWGEDRDRCRREARHVRRLVTRINAELGEGWRSLPRLAVQAPVPEWGTYMIDEETLAELQTPRPASQRPVEALHRSGWFILRVQGVKVLHREARTDWLGLPPEMSMDSYVPNLHEFHGDAATGVMVVTMDYESASCMSDTNPVYHVVTVAPEVFEAIEQRAGNVRTLFS